MLLHYFRRSACTYQRQAPEHEQEPEHEQAPEHEQEPERRSNTQLSFSATEKCSQVSHKEIIDFFTMFLM